jgi:hypothetical protein
MSTLSQFSGGAATRSIVNFCSSGATSLASINGNGATNCAREVLSGALTAATLKDIVSITGGGSISYLSAYAKNATSRTVRLVVVLDGVTVFDATSSAVTANGSGLMAVGTGAGSSTYIQAAPIRWNSSCVIRVASSLTETDNVAVAYSLI